MSVIASTDINNTNDEVLFDRKTFDKLQTIDIEGLIYDHSSDEEINHNDVDNVKIKIRHAAKVDEEG